MSPEALKRCPRCGRVRPAAEFYRRCSGRLSSYCQSYQQAAALAARRRHRQDPAAVEQRRAVDRTRQRRNRAMGGQEPER